MKFKNEPNADNRIMSVSDNEDDTLDVRVFTGGEGYKVCLTIGGCSTVGFSKAKARKLARAILLELDLTV